MDTSNWINLGILVLTALGFVAALRQANSARGSASDAKQHEQAALEISRKMAEANERAAVALEDANALRRAASAKPRWLITKIDRSRYRLENQGPGTAFNVGIEVPNFPAGLVRTFDLPKARLEQGLAVSFLLTRAIGTPMDPTVVVTWCDTERGEVLTAKTTISD